MNDPERASEPPGSKTEAGSEAQPAYLRPLHALLRRGAVELRLRRAERWAWCGFFWSAVLAVLALAAKGSLGGDAGLWVLVLLAAGLVTGAAAGALRSVNEADLAQATDRAFGMHDRVATTLEWLRRGDRGEVGRALIADTRAKLESLPLGRIWRRSLPREARMLPVPLFACIALLLAPPLPSAQALLKHVGVELARGPDAHNAATRNERSKSLDAASREKEKLAEREAAQRAREQERAAGADSAAFKDRTINARQRDFAEFVRKGDERLKLLERTDGLPDLQADFASSRYRTLMRRSQDLRAGNESGRLSTQKLGQILREIERMGKRAGAAADQAREGLAALDEGYDEEAMEAMEGALDKLREMEDRQRSGRNLSGGPDQGQTDESGSNEGGNSRDDRNRRDGYSLAQSNSQAKGTPAPRLRSTPYDAAIQGARRAGAPGVDTMKTGRPGSTTQSLQYLGEMLRYQRMMEDAIAREEVPREYQDHVRNYFKSIHD